MDFFCGDAIVLFGGSAPKSRDGKVVESGLFPHLDSFTERIDKHLHYTLPPSLPLRRHFGNHQQQYLSSFF